MIAMQQQVEQLLGSVLQVQMLVWDILGQTKCPLISMDELWELTRHLLGTVTDYEHFIGEKLLAQIIPLTRTTCMTWMWETFTVELLAAWTQDDWICCYSLLQSLSGELKTPSDQHVTGAQLNRL